MQAAEQRREEEAARAAKEGAEAPFAGGAEASSAAQTKGASDHGAGGVEGGELIQGARVVVEEAAKQRDREEALRSGSVLCPHTLNTCFNTTLDSPERSQVLRPD